jgi:amidohydrolase
MSIDFMAEAQAMREELIARRRDFHQHPELAFQEFRTAGIVAQELNHLGLEVQTGVGKTGVVAILEGAKDGPTILVRADMDALPIEEANKTIYNSTESGKMHACGHDGHTAIGLAVAKIFSQNRDKMAGRIKFVFQPAEEVGQGAKAMIADGALENPRPTASLGLHLWNTSPLGKINMTTGPVMAAASDFTMTIRGKGGHGASPHQAVDPLVCAAQITLAMQTIVSRNADPLDSAVVSVTQFHSGTASNIIPDSAYLNGTFRTFRREVRDLVEKRIREIAEGIATAMACTLDIQIGHYTEAVTNAAEVAAITRRAFEKLGKTEDDFTYERTMGAEDVGEFMTDVPGMYFFVGSANPDRGLDYPHHHPRFDFDEDALPLGVALLSAAVAEYLIQED